MKFTLSILICLFIFSPVFSQSLDGSWGGILYARKDNAPAFPYFFFLDAKQSGNRLAGVYSFSDSSNIDSYNCLTSVSSKLSKRPSSVFEINQEKVEDFEKKYFSDQTCRTINRMSVHYFLVDGTEYLTGKWFTTIDDPILHGLGGLFVLTHLDKNSYRDINKYFKARKTDEADTSLYQLKPDSKTYATPDEKRLIESLKTFLSKQSTP